MECGPGCLGHVDGAGLGFDPSCGGLVEDGGEVGGALGEEGGGDVEVRAGIGDYGDFAVSSASSVSKCSLDHDSYVNFQLAFIFLEL